MKNTISQKIFNAINNWKLKITEWKRKWYNYIVSVQLLNIERNNKDWFIFDIYDLENNFLERVNIEIKQIIEYWCVHNKMFLDN